MISIIILCSMGFILFVSVLVFLYFFIYFLNQDGKENAVKVLGFAIVIATLLCTIIVSKTIKRADVLGKTSILK